MSRKVLFASLVLPFLLALVASAQPAIEEIKRVKPKPSVLKDAKLRKPLVIGSAEEAGKHFGKDALAALKKQVDFEKQIVLVFAWRGSGQDRLTYTVLESHPEQVPFKYKPGRTRDLRPHIHVYALRSNVRWTAP
ncbi:MAG: hypothetical protein HQ567_23250 [Candidatus Nealsonbacteria bacterium]|nr:hypothetical protein [Candidatus Nealsonbacteria bacterium]